MKSKKIALVVLSILLSALIVQPQGIKNLQSKKKVYGTVLDQNSREPLPFASIAVLGKNLGTISNEQGEFSLELLPGTYQFRVSFVGYKTETFSVDVTDSDLCKNLFLIPTSLMFQEVSVYASRSVREELSTTTMQSKRIEQISNVLPDVFRSVQALPGITANNEFSSKFNVRGGNYDENLVYVNNVYVNDPFHLKYVENASVGIFNINMIKKVNMMVGGFGAKYGDRLSSVMDIEYRTGKKDKIGGSASISMISLDALLEGPLTKNVTFIFGARKSYLEYVLGLMDIEGSPKPSYFDLQGTINYNYAKSNHLQLNFLYSGDKFNQGKGLDKDLPSHGKRTYTTGETTTYILTEERYENRKASYETFLMNLQHSTYILNNLQVNSSLSYFNQVDRKNELETKDYNFEEKVTTLTGSTYDFVFLMDEYDEIVNKLNLGNLEVKSDLKYKVNPILDINSGLSYSTDICDGYFLDKDLEIISEYRSLYPDTSKWIIDRSEAATPKQSKFNSFKISGYAEGIFQLKNRMFFNLGGRVDYFDLNSSLTFSPRLSASFRLWNGSMLRTAWGHYFQNPTYKQIDFLDETIPAPEPQKAVHYIAGFEQKINLTEKSLLTLKVEAYYKDYSNLISAIRSPAGYVRYSGKNDSKGYAKGLDLFLVFQNKWYYGWISYGWLKAEEELEGYLYNPFPRYADQRHSYSWINSFNFRRGWSISLNFCYGSGFAYTPQKKVWILEKWNYEWMEGKKNSAYLPSYFRSDLKFSKEFKLKHMLVSASIDINNLFDNKNIYGYGYSYNPSGYVPLREELELWPLIPSFGVKVTF
ncbi:MAG: carboxypeptidase-like regulatory domain-containing protein [Bacteroidetes bacterium]|nr:carboxypeptidase-like regulatory domain-containing protein [Bacteroidota bacterium]